MLDYTFLRSLDDRLNLLLERITQMAATLDQVLADVTAQTTKIDSLAAFIAGLKQQLADALAGVTLSPAAQAKVDAVFAQLEQNTGKIDTALGANVPPSP